MSDLATTHDLENEKLNNKGNTDVENMDNVESNMEDGMNSQADASSTPASKPSKVSLSASEIEDSWSYMKDFNNSAVIRSKKNSSDGFMDEVCDTVGAVPSHIDSQKNFEAALKKTHEACEEYIENKNPWLPKGKRRKQAVITLRNTISSFLNSEIPSMVYATILIKEKPEILDELTEETKDDKFSTGAKTYQTALVNIISSDGPADENKKDYRDKFTDLMENDKKRKEVYSKKIFGGKFDVDDDNQLRVGVMVRTLQLQFKGKDTEETIKNMQSWNAKYDEYLESEEGVHGNELEPIFDIIMKQDIYIFLPHSPKDIIPGIFLQRYKILELADAADRGADHYYRYLKRHPESKYANKYKELLFKISILNYLKEMYDLLKDVIMDPKFQDRNVDAFELLNFDEGVLHEMISKTESDTPEYNYLYAILFLKEYMNKYKIKFGDNAGMEILIQEAESNASGWAESYYD